MPTALSAGFYRAFVADGRLALRLSAWALCAAGVFAIILAATGRFLPHDEAYLGMTARELCALHGCRIVHFMIHDRLSFGGALIAHALLYWWLIDSPLRRREAWAWWLLLISNVVGFLSFFAYLGYGYLDTWHGLATLALLPGFAFGLLLSRPSDVGNNIHTLFQPAVRWPWLSRAGTGRALLLMTGAGITFGGLTILIVGMTCVFVPQDLVFMDLSVAELEALIRDWCRSSRMIGRASAARCAARASPSSAASGAASRRRACGGRWLPSESRDSAPASAPTRRLAMLTCSISRQP
jgi:hypothetical protein